MRSCKQNVAGASSLSQPENCTRISPTLDKNHVMQKAQQKVSTLTAKKKVEIGARRSTRILNLHKPAKEQVETQQVIHLEVSDSETEVELQNKEKYAEPVIQLLGSENVEGDYEKGERGQSLKRTITNVDSHKETSVLVTAGQNENQQTVGVAETQGGKQVNNAAENQDVPVDRLSCQEINDNENIYKIRYTKAMRRLEAVTEERNILSRQLAMADTKIGVLNDFKDQLNEVSKKLDIANERLKVYQMTMNPQMLDMLRDFLAFTTKSQPVEVPHITSSDEDVGLNKATKPLTRSSKKRKCHRDN